jgi:hypothetical protein
MTRYKIGVFPKLQPRTPVFQVLCGSFLGPGSRAMVASVAIPSCGGSITWAVFRYAAGSWQLVLRQNHGAFLAAVGSDIREEIGVLAPGDAHCFPSSVKFRLWHWSGGRLRPGAWATALELTSFLSPDLQIWCSFVPTDGPAEAVYCGHKAAPIHSVQLENDGTFTPCGGVNCVQEWDDKARVLKVGQAVERSNLICLAAQASVTCTVIGGKPAGKGFRFDAASATAVG